MDFEASRRPSYFTPQLGQSKLLAKNEIRANNVVGARGFGCPSIVEQNRLMPCSSLALNPSHNLVINGDGQGYQGDSSKQPSDQIDTLFGINVSQQLSLLQADAGLIVEKNIRKMRMETKLMFKRHMRFIEAAFFQKANERIHGLEVKLHEMNQMNSALREQMVNLTRENQTWENFAKKKEETGNTLCENLNQLIAQATITLEEVVPGKNNCNSYCGGNSIGGGGNVEGVEQEVEMVAATGVGCGDGSGRMCLKCGMIECSILIIPCKHLGLCQVYGTILPATCPPAELSVMVELWLIFVN